jgi:DNA processing protein
MIGLTVLLHTLLKLCALSQAVVVIESGPAKDSRGNMSGTFDAGRSAMKMGRHIFV